MKSCCLAFLIPLAVVLVAPALAAEDSCADRSVVASAVRTPQDARAFVQCAYEYVRKTGTEEARRAFHEDERWKSGPTYVFVANSRRCRVRPVHWFNRPIRRWRGGHGGC